MILLSDVAISKVACGLFSVVTPGYTKIETSTEGIICLVWADGSRDLREAVSRARSHLAEDQWDVSGFIRNAIELGLLYRSRSYRRHVFSPSGLTQSLHSSRFRSLSEINLCPSNKCNLRCSYCNLWKGDASLSTADIQKILADGHKIGANILNILGGEPTLYPTLTGETIAAAKALGYERITVSINGTSLSEKTAILWKRCGLKTIQVSMDGLEGPGKSFENGEAAVRTACSHFSEVIIGYVYYGQESRTCLLPLVDCLKSYPVVLDLKVMTPLEGERLPISPIEIARFSQEAQKLKARYDFVLVPEFTDIGHVFCGAGLSHLFIEADGTVKACGFLNKTFGHVKKMALTSIWLSNDWEYFTRPRTIRMAQCTDCTYSKFCIAGCTARYRSKQNNCIWSPSPNPGARQRICMASKVS